MAWEVTMDTSTKRGIVKTFSGIVILAIIFTLILFVGSGRWDWVMAWVYIAIMVIGAAVSPFLLDAELLAERSAVKEGTKKWDIPLASFIGRIGPLLTVLTAALDKRYQWSPLLPAYLDLAFAMVAVVAYVFVLWALAVNKFFAPVVRIQKERGHTVITDGPYKFIRHPGYAGSILFTAATPIMLGSLWALIPAGLTVIVTVVRTALEDRTLKDELIGYADYAAKVRYRLMPGIW
jgi:protein-S-isoprenylcysteine O-methyltransferase Ste14